MLRPLRIVMTPLGKVNLEVIFCTLLIIMYDHCTT